VHTHGSTLFTDPPAIPHEATSRYSTADGSPPAPALRHHAEHLQDLLPVTRLPGDPAVVPAQQLTPEVLQFIADELYQARLADLQAQEDQRLRARGLAPPTSTTTAHLAHQVLVLPVPQTRASLVVPVWVWKYSAVALATGGAIALAGAGVGAAAPGLAALDELFAAAGQFVLGVTVLFLIAYVLLGVCAGTGKKAANGGTVVRIRKAVFKRNRFQG
jgi:hypothetical protein